jgi:hypothetical protein
MSKYLLLSADPNAWRELREQTLSETHDQSKYQPSLREILSLSAQGYQVGLAWDKTHLPMNCNRDESFALIGHLRDWSHEERPCWKAWHDGFKKGIEENPRIKVLDPKFFIFHCFEVLRFDPRCTCTFGS